jgi:hypothetical protein
MTTDKKAPIASADGVPWKDARGAQATKIIETVRTRVAWARSRLMARHLEAL